MTLHFFRTIARTFATSAMMPLVLLISGCGVESGATSSPDGASSELEFSGRILTPAAAPVAALTLSIPATGASTSSAQDGTFSLPGRSVAGDITLELRPTTGDTVTLLISEVPAGASVVDLAIEFDAATSTARITKMTVDPAENEDPVVDGAPTPSDPSRTPRPTATPKPESDRETAIKKGQQVYRRVCSNCHGAGKGTGKSASQLKEVMQLSQHRSVSLSKGDLTALVQFLNK